MEVPVILSHGLHHVIVAGTPGHSLAICRPAYAHLARFVRYALLTSLCSLSEQYSRDPG